MFAVTQYQIPNELSPSSNSSEDSSSPTNEKIKKSSAACEYCRKHHRKCNGVSPCPNCVEKGIECIYTARKKRGPKNEATKKMKEELATLKEDFDSLKKSEQSWKRKYMTALGDSTNNETLELVEVPKKRLRTENVTLKSNMVDYLSKTGMDMGSGQSVAYCSMINDFIQIFEKYIHPNHPLLPVSAAKFNSIVPELFSAMVRDDGSDVIGNFYMNSMLSIGALVSGNVQLSQEFAHRARRYAGDVFDIDEMRVGSGFIMLAYYSYCIGDRSKSATYSGIAKRIAESEVPFSDMHMNTLVGIGYASKNYDERMKIFQSLGNGKTLGDQVFSLVGQVETELQFQDNPNWPTLIDMLMKAMRIQNEAGPQTYVLPQDKFVHDVLLNGGLTRTLHRAKFADLALEYAKKVLALSSNPYFDYACVGVTCNALEASAEVFLDQKCEQELNMVRGVLLNLSKRYKSPSLAHERITDKLAKQKLEAAVRQELSERIALEPALNMSQQFAQPVTMASPFLMLSPTPQQTPVIQTPVTFVQAIDNKQFELDLGLDDAEALFLTQQTDVQGQWNELDSIF